MTADPVHGRDAERWGGWSWREPEHGEHFRRCSYCGSIHPDDLAAEPAWRANWADWKYGWPHKFYVDMPNRDPGALFAVGSTNGPDPQTDLNVATAGGPQWVAVADLTDEQRAIIERDRMASESTTYWLFDTRPNHFGKFYSVHLGDPEIADSVKDIIGRRSGLRFRFQDGRVSWEPYAEAVSP